ELLSRHPWRGNVRELRNFVYRAALMAREDVIDAASVQSLLGQRPGAATVAENVDFQTALQAWLSEENPAGGTLYHSALAAFEKPLFEYALRQTGGNQLRASQLLGINRNTLRKRLEDLEIDPDGFVRRN
ncbi:MAG TPA: helix-turn-helix domain-containing protein, partial [Sphingomonadaceae bacterium]|nr:helix-turn-helix domain-containing protein [Sphingomonadaceae bacterium]